MNSPEDTPSEQVARLWVIAFLGAAMRRRRALATLATAFSVSSPSQLDADTVGFRDSLGHCNYTRVRPRVRHGAGRPCEGCATLREQLQQANDRIAVLEPLEWGLENDS